VYYHSSSDKPAQSGFEVVDVTRKWIPANGDDLIKRYVSGESEKALAYCAGVGRPTLSRFLVRNGVQRRGRGTANSIRMGRLDVASRREITRAAHAARRGSKDTIATREQRAATRERLAIGVSGGEIEAATLLAGAGVVGAIPQKAIGPYNVDLGIEPVAVEIHGGSWHGYGRHERRTAERYRKILDKGWAVVIIWVGDGYYSLSVNAANYVAAFVQQVRCNPSLRGEYRVIRGDGYEVASGRDDLHKLAFVPSSARRPKPGRAYQRSGGKAVGV